MGYFFGDVECKLIDGRASSGRGLWELTAPLIYHTDIYPLEITVPAGFQTDFASVPRVPIAFLLCGDTASEAACVHDWLYSTESGPVGALATVDRKTADKILCEAAYATDVPMWRCCLLYAGVRMFGQMFYKVKQNAEGIGTETQA